MDSLCGAFDCLACLKDGQYWLELLNHTKCCIWNAATFDISYEMLLQPGDENMCPAVYSLNALSVSLGCFAGIGALAGIGVGISCWIRSRRLQGRLVLAGEETRRLMEISSRHNCCEKVGAARDIVGGEGPSRSHEAIVRVPPQQQQQQQQRAEPEHVALYSARSRSSLAALPYHVFEGKNEEQRGEESKALISKKGKHFGGGGHGGSRCGGGRTTDRGAENEMEMYEMIPL